MVITVTRKFRVILWLKITVFNLIIANPLSAALNTTANKAPEQRDGENRKEIRMAERDMSFIKVTDIVRRAHMQASGVVTDGERQSLPIPVIQDGEPWIVFIFSPSIARPKEAAKMYAPTYYLRLNARTGKLKELLSVTPKDFNQNHTADDIIGEFAMPAELSFEEYTAKRNRLYAIYDELFPVYFANGRIKTPQLQALAKEFSPLFKLLSEPPLLPYYQATGGQFFEWVMQKEK